MLIFDFFLVGFGVWEGLQSMGNGCGLQMDGFSAHFEPSESISNEFHDFGHFDINSGRLTLFPEGPWTLESALKAPGPCESVLWWSDAASGKSQAPPGLP